MAGAVGWTYALTLGLALVYLGEHYAVDLIGGAALAEGVRAAAPRLTPLYRRLSAGLQALELRAADSSGADGPEGAADDGGFERRGDRGEMPAGSPAGDCSPRCCSSPRRSRSCTSCCRSCSGCTRPGTGSSTATAGGSPWPRCSRSARSSATCALFRGVFVRGESRIDWRESYQITMAGLAATRLFAAAGAGGIALTAWALRRSGMRPRTVGLPDDRVHGAPVRRVHGHAGDRRRRPVPGRDPRRRLVRDHDRAGDLRRGRDRAVPRHLDAARDFERVAGRWTAGRRRASTARVPPRRGVGDGGQRRAHGDRPRARARPEPAGGDRLVGVRHRRAVGVLPRVRRLAAEGCDRDVVLRRDARQHAAAARAGSAASTAA